METDGIDKYAAERFATTDEVRHVSNTILVVAVALFCISLAIGAVGFVTNRHRISDNAEGRIQAREALCDQDNKIKEGLREVHLKQALRTYKIYVARGRALPTGFTRHDVDQSIEDQVDTAQKLPDVACNKFAHHPNDPPQYVHVTLPPQLESYR